MSRTIVTNGEIAASAERILAASQVARRELAIEFEQSAASSVALHVEGRNFYPPMLADIAAAAMFPWVTTGRVMSLSRA